MITNLSDLYTHAYEALVSGRFASHNEAASRAAANCPAPEVSAIGTSDNLGDLLGDAYQLAGEIVAPLPDDPRHVRLLDLLDSAARLTEAQHNDQPQRESA